MRSATVNQSYIHPRIANMNHCGGNMNQWFSLSSSCIMYWWKYIQDRYCLWLLKECWRSHLPIRTSIMKQLRGMKTAFWASCREFLTWCMFTFARKIDPYCVSRANIQLVINHLLRIISFSSQPAKLSLPTEDFLATCSYWYARYNVCNNTGLCSAWKTMSNMMHVLILQ